ncbi:MAG: hypothetical protein ACK4M3_05915 [Pyrobaculum sp.]
MDWMEKFLIDAEKIFQIPRDKLKKFVEYISSDPEKVQEWAEEIQLPDIDFLMLTTIYTLYKTEEKVTELLSQLELKLDEAVGLISTAAASLLNSLPQDDRKPILAQLILSTALQLEDAALRNSLVEYARVLLAE